MTETVIHNSDPNQDENVYFCNFFVNAGVHPAAFPSSYDLTANCPRCILLLSLQGGMMSEPARFALIE
jgi:hypothetical protein